ncbi:ABC transporter substrate-binding protein [Rhodoplanes sp. TEM]|uniref:ABC transporter substrate-binding protein n=1 Tax=Rhodoplanes tepidamans TaxID=200616 RepID=A0ABT5J5D8_RHOTP|nr:MULTISPECIES: ABC transporter substrate-binding protein [Rhodoplanes]MDC7784841.1 ABC transporter substrate-binding protein [Rhodoplanes tepidamans]MDC7982308.1 ABC transporter substrate-binding protein [Rhodoplanes sp. TEM]MDQ0356317.1 NitT/TauT family transport system ATP-binding protein [Rhodoplanes tepidamans]
MTRLSVGYVPLTDAAVLIAAAERGFAAAEGLDLVPVRETSWANIRDKLVFGHFDAAHMLAPLAVATTLGLGHVALPLAAPFWLNLGGNAVTVSRPLAAQLAAKGGLSGRLPDAAAALGAVARERAAAGQGALTFAAVFPFSTHAYQLRTLFVAAGLDPERDVRLVVVPPPFMVDALRRGLVDGFCVGSPWNSVAVDQGVGTILLLGNAIVRRAPEKVLAVPAERAGAPEAAALIRALAAAAAWCSAPENREDLAAVLGEPRHLDLPAAVILRTLDGALVVDADGTVRTDPEFLLLGANRPEPAQADWLFDAMAAAGHLPEGSRDAVRAVFRTDLYDAALGRPAGP